MCTTIITVNIRIYCTPGKKLVSFIHYLHEIYLANDLETLSHGKRKQLPHNQMTHRSITNVLYGAKF